VLGRAPAASGARRGSRSRAGSARAAFVRSRLRGKTTSRACVLREKSAAGTIAFLCGSRGAVPGKHGEFCFQLVWVAGDGVLGKKNWGEGAGAPAFGAFPLCCAREGACCQGQALAGDPATGVPGHVALTP